MRTYEEDIAHRRELRRHYFEDPAYRTWSSIAPPDTRRFAHSRDDVLFCYYLNGSDSTMLTGSMMKKLLDKGHELPINWESLYAYFDNRANDEECIYRKSILNESFISFESGIPGNKPQSIMDILNEYRERLLKPNYDII